MRERLKPWMPAILCSGISVISVTAYVVGRYKTGSDNGSLLTFTIFMPQCFFHVGMMLKDLREENNKLKQKLDQILREQKHVPASGPASD